MFQIVQYREAYEGGVEVMEFRENLTRLRLEKHLTQMDSAEKTGVSLDVVVQWENGDTEPPIQDLISISSGLTVRKAYMNAEASRALVISGILRSIAVRRTL